MTTTARAIPTSPRIGCVVNGGMGDQVLSLPALRYLAYWLGPDAFEVTFVGDEAQSWLLRALLGTYVQVRPASTVAAEYDWCLDMNLTSNPYRMPPHMAVQKAVFCFERPQVPNRAIIVPARTACWRMYLEMAKRLINELGAPAALRAGDEKLLRTGLPLPPSSETRERVGRWMGGFTAEQRSVAVTPGGYNPGYKRWPRERFAQIVAELGRRGLSVLLIGSERERELCDAIAAEALELAPGATPPRVLAGQVPLEDLPHLLLQADLHLTNDNGVSHVAGALHRPQLVLYRGWAERNRHVTLGFRDVALYSGADGTAGCMDGIQTEQVLAALAGLLEQLGRQG